jgi:hypothetical protein
MLKSKDTFTDEEKVLLSDLFGNEVPGATRDLTDKVSELKE